MTQSTGKSFPRYSKFFEKDGRETVFLEDIGNASSAFRINIRNYANGLLNSHGGIIYFGVDASGKILGKKISRKEEDEYRLTIDHVFWLIPALH